ncbi:MAG: thioredoxin domain-containing protein [Alphaproteobacteria bacterium]|nr:thioredoxin domain-containing protein [Alphaproteobacteria bacterium]MBT4711849.1 thioredoxin domain-containing protein [Alphaproteobacteria bacterium]MBT5860539.1 thioredoxin domain-containing protein [Alphaproteobacteria bacterium]
MISGVALGLLFSGAALGQPAIPANAMTERVLGSPDAEITIVEYASLTCPHCAAFHVETLPRIKSEFIETGIVRFVYRDFPLDQLAFFASILARCGPEDQYFDLLNTLFTRQEEWALAEDPIAALIAIGEGAGIPQENFEACTADETLTGYVLKMRSDAEQAGLVESTPTFVVGDILVSGALPFDEFTEVIDQALDRASGIFDDDQKSGGIPPWAYGVGFILLAGAFLLFRRRRT